VTNKKLTERLEPRTTETTAQRRRLEIADHRTGGLTIKHDEDTFNPYDRSPVDSATARPVKRDLRKLSEWIKTMRAVEEKKSRGED
jgi:hypothetical protein